MNFKTEEYNSEELSFGFEKKLRLSTIDISCDPENLLKVRPFISLIFIVSPP